MRRSGGTVGTSASPTREGWGMTDTPPTMFQRPTDPCRPPPPLRSGGPIARMHTEWARLDAAPGNTSSVGDRLRVKARSVAARVTGSADRQFLAELVRAVDAVAARCDELSERVGKLDVIADDLTRFGKKRSHSYGRQSKGWPTGNPGHPPLRRREREANMSHSRDAEFVVVETGYGALVRGPRRGGGSVTLGRDYDRCADGPRRDPGRRGVRCGRDRWDCDIWLAGARTGPRGRARLNPSSTWIVDEPGADARVLFQAFGDGAAFSIAPGATGDGRCAPVVAPHAWPCVRRGRDARHARPHKSVGQRTTAHGTRLHRLHPGTH